MVIGKFVRVKRDQGELAEGVFNELDMMGDSLERLMKDFKNLKADFENLQKTFQYDNSTLAGSMEQIENRIGQIYETEEGLRQDVNLVLRADDEHPVTAVFGSAKPNKGGRPRKEPV